MEAVAKGAYESGGSVVGILPGLDRVEANPYLSVAIPAGLGELRNALVVRAGQAVIAVGSSWGTLSAISLAMRTEQPVILLGGWSIRDDDDREVRVGVHASSPRAAVAVALNAIGR